MSSVSKFLSIGLASALASTSALADANPEFVDFAIRAAHQVAFNSCDAAIRDAFKNAGGKDIRVWTDVMDESRKDSLQISGAYGRDNDMVFVDASIRRVGGTCVMQVSSTIDMDQSCQSYLSDNPVWKVDSATGNILGVKNGRGVTAILRPVEKSCVITYRRGNAFKAG